MWLTALACGEVLALPVRESLAMFESGATHIARCQSDKMRGRSGEVSRYQIMPDVWRQYTKSREFDNPEVAWHVAQRILQDRTDWFRSMTGREPDALELYLLWNKPGHFKAAEFDTDRVQTHFKRRAQRFANLCALSPSQSPGLMPGQLGLN